MIEIEIPGRGVLTLENLVMDVNGTLAVDGILIAGVAPRLNFLKTVLNLHMITADTHGRQSEIDQTLGLKARRLAPEGQIEQKAAFVRMLGAEKTAAIGQGANDVGMLSAAALGICVGSPEGTAIPALMAADLFAPDILTALDLLLNPRRISGTLRI